jgi:uncharacterized protein
MKELAEYIVKNLVDNPELVTIKAIDGDQIMVLELKVANNDTGKIIGRQGRMADALRTILSAVASKQRKRMVLEIVD